MLMFGCLITTIVFAAPVLQMNKAFNALSDLIPFLTDESKFMEKKNSKLIEARITELQVAFKSAKHDTLIKEDLFAPSYKLINENIAGSLIAFKEGKKDYAHWRLKEITSLCLDCHTRMPASHPSSFQNGELQINPSKFEDAYNLGIAQLIVRRYVDAKASFTKSIQDKLIKNEMNDIILPFKQLLLIDTKVLKNPENLQAEFQNYQNNKKLPEVVKLTLSQWLSRLDHWKKNKFLKSGLNSDKDVIAFINQELIPLKKNTSYESSRDVDLLFASGLLSNFLFENPSSQKAPEIGFWLGWTEKFLKRENFFGSGDLFLKQCILKYSEKPIAQKCFEEYKESITFEFSGSAGTNIPKDVQDELNGFEKLIKKK